MSKLRKLAASFENVLSGKTLDERMVELARARIQEHDAKARMKQVRDDMHAQFQDELAVAGNAIELAAARTEEAERVARERAMIEFKAGQGRKPHQNVQIKQYTVLDYDAQKALDYSCLNLPSCVKLDKRAFEKAAKVVQLEFVQIGNEDRVTISRDLSPLLAE